MRDFHIIRADVTIRPAANSTSGLLALELQPKFRELTPWAFTKSHYLIEQLSDVQACQIVDNPSDAAFYGVHPAQPRPVLSRCEPAHLQAAPLSLLSTLVTTKC